VVADDTLEGLHATVSPESPGNTKDGTVSLEAVFLTLTGRSLRD
jgi:hypothetical protein